MVRVSGNSDSNKNKLKLKKKKFNLCKSDPPSKSVPSCYGDARAKLSTCAKVKPCKSDAHAKVSSSKSVHFMQKFHLVQK